MPQQYGHKTCARKRCRYGAGRPSWWQPHRRRRQGEGVKRGEGCDGKSQATRALISALRCATAL